MDQNNTFASNISDKDGKSMINLSNIPGKKSILEQTDKKTNIKQLDILSTPRNELNNGYNTNAKAMPNMLSTPKSDFIPEDSIEDYGQTTIEDLNKIQVNFHV